MPTIEQKPLSVQYSIPIYFQMAFCVRYVNSIICTPNSSNLSRIKNAVDYELKSGILYFVTGFTSTNNERKKIA